MPGTEPLPADCPLTIYRGDTRVWQDIYVDTDTGQPIDFTGHTFLAQIRATKDDTDIMAVMVVDDSQANVGRITRTLTHDEASKVTGLPSAYWDMQITRTADDFVRTYLAGKIRIKPDVSRP